MQMNKDYFKYYLLIPIKISAAVLSIYIYYVCNINVKLLCATNCLSKLCGRTGGDSVSRAQLIDIASC